MRVNNSAIIFAELISILSLSTAVEAANKSGFKTVQPSMLTPVAVGVEVTPLLTVGDVLPESGFRFEAIPDGISLLLKGKGRVDLFISHNTSKIPFPYNTATPTTANGESDFDNAQVSLLKLNQKSVGVLEGSFVVPSTFGYQRFASNYLATTKEGFDRNVLFTGEEAIDYVFRQENSWPPPIGDAAEREAGVVVALDVKAGTRVPIYGMGRLSHENSVAVPGFDSLVVLTGDDSFTTGSLLGRPAQSQLYSYIALNTNALLSDGGDLWAFVSDTPGFDDYYDFVPGSATSITGHFVKVPKTIATGRNPDGSEIKAADLGYPLPPTDGTWQRDVRSASPLGIDGPQWVLEFWSGLNNVFQFVRLEDIAYDKRPGLGNVIYIADSGRGTAGAPQAGRSTNGRVWKMVLDPTDPKIVTSLSIFVEGDDNPVKIVGEIHQPDNIETTATGLLLTEDPGSSQQFPVGLPDPNATTARVWFVPFSGTPEVVANVDQSADGGPTDVDSRPLGNLGAWEPSGIVDASAAFGAGAFLINVQAHTLWVEKADGPDFFAPAGPDFTFKRESGQLLLMRVPGL